MDTDRRNALISALERTEELAFCLENVLRQDFERKPERSDFSRTADLIIRKNSPKEEVLALQEPLAVEEEITLDSLCEKVGKCMSCRLCETRKNAVFGEGCKDSPLVLVIGEGPGENEDESARPFVGRAGQYLDQWLGAISLSRQTNCYITNVVKCRPPQNRDPYPDEVSSCEDYLSKQIELLNPRAILCLGKSASSLMTGQTEASMSSMRGRFYFYDKKIPMICTYHPAAVLRDLSLKRAVWDDLQKLAKFLNLDIRRAK